MQSMADFLRRYAVKMWCERVETNPNLDTSDTWSQRATHWKCTLSHQGRSMSILFSQGSAHREDPTLEEVLDCLASDSVGLDAGFESWAEGLGYDSRKAERIYNLCRAQAAQFEALLGAEAFDALLHHTE